VRVGEQDALRGEPIQPRAKDIGVAVRAEVAAEVVPMHEQHVVASLGQCLSFLPRRYTEQ
jgi:negative regulator of sigma E activity